MTALKVLLVSSHSGSTVAGELYLLCIICSIGAIANVGIATVIYAEQPIWWLAGLAGAAVGAIWNYALSAFFTWKNR